MQLPLDDLLGWNGLEHPDRPRIRLNAVFAARFIAAQGRLQSVNILEGLPNRLLDLEKKR